VTIEVGPGDGTVLELAAGAHVVSVRYVEIKQAEAHVPAGTLRQSLMVAPGTALLLSLQGGRSSPDGMMYVAPRLMTR
jgi:hypothetical protein